MLRVLIYIQMTSITSHVRRGCYPWRLGVPLSHPLTGWDQAQLVCGCLFGEGNGASSLPMLPVYLCSALSFASSLLPLNRNSGKTTTGNILGVNRKQRALHVCPETPSVTIHKFGSNCKICHRPAVWEVCVDFGLYLLHMIAYD